MKATLYFFLFILIFPKNSFAQFEQIQQLKENLSKIEGKISIEKATEIVEKLYFEKVINEEGKKQFLGFIQKRIFPKFINRAENDTSKTAKAISQAGLFAPMILGADTTNINRNYILIMLGYLDLLNSNLKVSPTQSAKANANKIFDEILNNKDKLNPVFGSKWLFKTTFEGDFENPFSIKYDLNKYRKNYLELLESINKSGLIDPNVYADTKVWLLRDEVIFFKDFSPILFSALRGIYYDIYPLLQSKQISAIDSLNIASLLSNEDALKLKGKVKNFNLLSKTDIFRSIKNVQFIEIEKFNSESKQIVLEKVYSKLTTLIPELKISDISFVEIASDETIRIKNDKAQQAFDQFTKFLNSKKMELSLKNNGRIYKKVEDSIELKTDSIKIEIPEHVYRLLTYAQLIQEKDFQIINEYLADTGSKKRVILVGNGLSIFPKPKYNEKVLLILDSLQYQKASVLMPFASFFHKPDYEGINSLSNLRKYYTGLFETSLVEKIEDSKVDEMIIETRKNGENTSYSFDFSKKLISLNPLNFTKLDFIKDKKINGNFEDFLMRISAISKGSFMPINIKSNFLEEEKSKDEKENKFFKFSFEVNGNTFSDSMAIEYLSEVGELKEMNDMMNFSNYGEIQYKILRLISAASGTKYRPYQFSSPENYCIYLDAEKIEEINGKLNNIFKELDLGILKQDSYEVEEKENYDEAPFDFEAHEKDLKAINLIDDRGIEKTKEANPGGITFGNLYYPYLKNTVEFNVKKYISKTNIQFFKNLYTTVGNYFLPNEKITNFKVLLDSTKFNRFGISENENFEEFVKVSYSINGQAYFDKFFNFEQSKKILLSSISENPSENLPMEYFNVVPIFNNYLTDKNSKFRLMFNTRENSIIVTKLNNNQADFLYQSNLFKNISKKQLKAEILKISELKLIKNITLPQIENSINEYRNTYFQLNILGLFNILKSNKVAIIIDPLSKENNWFKIVETFLGQELKISNFEDNRFEFLNQKENQYKKIHSDSKLNSIEYSGSLLVENRKIDFKIDALLNNLYQIFLNDIYKSTLKEINEILKKKGKKNLFYISGTYLYYLNNSQKNYLMKNGIEFDSKE